MLFVTDLSTLRSVLLNLSLTFLALSVRFLCAQSSLTGATLKKSDQLPDQVESQPPKQGKFVFRGRKRILSQKEGEEQIHFLVLSNNPFIHCYLNDI